MDVQQLVCPRSSMEDRPIVWLRIGVIIFQLWQLNAVFLAALFNQQTLYDRQLAVRMDKWVDPILQDIPKRMPSGLKSLGVGFGAAGYPLLNIAQISSECRFTW